MKKLGTISLDNTPKLAADGTIHIPKGNRPVGNNLYMKREPEAYTKILKELGLS